MKGGEEGNAPMRRTMYIRWRLAGERTISFQLDCRSSFSLRNVSFCERERGSCERDSRQARGERREARGRGSRDAPSRRTRTAPARRPGCRRRGTCRREVSQQESFLENSRGFERGRAERKEQDALDEKVERFLLTALGHEEPRRLGHELDGDEEVERGRDLDDVGDPPAPIALRTSVRTTSARA